MVCLTSALAFHGLTDQIPRRIWLAIGSEDRQSSLVEPKPELIRLSETQLGADIDIHEIGLVPVRIFNVPRTIVDSFHFRRSVGLSVAVTALREALQLSRTTPSEIAECAQHTTDWQ